MRLRRRGPRPGVEVGRGESVLAWAEAADGTVLAGTRDALYLDGSRVPWEEVEAADWDRDSEQLRFTEVGRWGEPRASHSFSVAEQRTFLELVRERVTASVVVQRHVPVRGSAGFRVVARRPPRGDRPIAWFVEYDETVEPDDPDVVPLVEASLAAARREVGED